MKRLVLCALLAGLLEPASLTTLVATAAHECTDHVCACARTAKGSCHEPEGRSEGLQASCNHDVPGAPATLAPAVPEAASTPFAALAAEPAPPEPSSLPRIGHGRIDSPPPRSL